MRLGRWDEAEQMLDEFRELVEHPSQHALLASGWARALLRQGRIREARPLVERTRALLDAGYWDQDIGVLAETVAEFDRSEHRHEAATSLARNVLARPHVGLFDVARLVAIAVAALADHAEADTGRDRNTANKHESQATSLFAMLHLEDLDGPYPTPAVELDLEEARAELGRLRGQPARERWARLAVGWQTLGLPYHEAHARWRHAEALLSGAAGRADAARKSATAELTAAHTLAGSLHAAPLLDEIDALARRAGITIATADANMADGEPPPHSHFGLTRREHEVLELIAEGHSNGQIARSLFISTKTASVHVSNILRKLSVTNRVEAAAVHHRLTPPPTTAS